MMRPKPMVLRFTANFAHPAAKDIMPIPTSVRVGTPTSPIDPGFEANPTTPVISRNFSGHSTVSSDGNGNGDNFGLSRNVRLEDFELIRVIGMGCAGRVSHSLLFTVNIDLTT